VLPPIPGLAEAAAWTNREATTAKAVPDRLIVLGGGVVGVELAQAWSSLGSKVTIVELAGRILVREEPFASEDVTAALVDQGIDVRTGVLAVAAERVGAEVILELQTGERLVADELLVAVGRRPVTDDLGLEAVGRQPGGFLTVDDQMRVGGSEWLYAIGDVNGRSLLTHMGKYQAWIAAENILGNPLQVATSAHGSLAPRVVFTDPQVAAVGHTLESALAAELDVVAIDHATGGVAGGSFFGRRAAGTSRIVVDVTRDVIVGATFTGPDVAELLHGATVAIVGEVPIERLRHAAPAFPTRSEVWLRLLEKLEEERAAVSDDRRLTAVARRE
ncbi:MAG: FAD-dependent oxidoreductase, partial [Actinomycetota bacterium]